MNEHVAQPFRDILESIRTRPITDDERAIVAGHEQMRTDLDRLRAVWRAVIAEMCED